VSKAAALQFLERVLHLTVTVLIFYALYLVFLVVPNERVMGPVQRIFYFHVGSAVSTYIACAAVLIGGLGYLATRRAEYDVLLEAGGELGFVFCLIVMASGMIWGHAAWNTWFNWEPRLVSFLILTLIFFSFNALRVFGDPKKIAQHCAVLGILGAVTVPLVVFSIQLLPQFAQLHPQVVGNRGLKDPSFETALFLTMGALVLFTIELIWLRFKIGVIERRVYE